MKTVEELMDEAELGLTGAPSPSVWSEPLYVKDVGGQPGTIGRAWERAKASDVANRVLSDLALYENTHNLNADEEVSAQKLKNLALRIQRLSGEVYPASVQGLGDAWSRPGVMGKVGAIGTMAVEGAVENAPIFGKMLVGGAIGGAIAGPVGASIGAGGAGLRMNIGESYGRLLEEGIDAPDRAISVGVLKSALDSIVPASAGGTVGRMLLRQPARAARVFRGLGILIDRYGKSTAVRALTHGVGGTFVEGTTEAAQTVLDELAALGERAFAPEHIENTVVQAIESAIKAGPMGAVSAIEAIEDNAPRAERIPDNQIRERLSELAGEPRPVEVEPVDSLPEENRVRGMEPVVTRVRPVPRGIDMDFYRNWLHDRWLTYDGGEEVAGEQGPVGPQAPLLGGPAGQDRLGSPAIPGMLPSPQISSGSPVGVAIQGTMSDESAITLMRQYGITDTAQQAQILMSAVVDRATNQVTRQAIESAITEKTGRIVGFMPSPEQEVAPQVVEKIPPARPPEEVVSAAPKVAPPESAQPGLPEDLRQLGEEDLTGGVLFDEVKGEPDLRKVAARLGVPQGLRQDERRAQVKEAAKNYPGLLTMAGQKLMAMTKPRVVKAAAEAGVDISIKTIRRSMAKRDIVEAIIAKRRSDYNPKGPASAEDLARASIDAKDYYKHYPLPPERRAAFDKIAAPRQATNSAGFLQILRNSLKKKGFSVEEADSVVLVAPKNTDAARMAQAVAAAYKLEVVWVKDKAGRFAGANLGEAVFLNVDNKDAYLQVLMHEVTETMKSEAPALYDGLIEYFKGMIADPGKVSEAIRGRMEEIQGRMKALGLLSENEWGADADEAMLGEVIANYAGELSREESFWVQMAKEAPKIFHEFMRRFREAIRALVGTINELWPFRAELVKATRDERWAALSEEQGTSWLAGEAYGRVDQDVLDTIAKIDTAIAKALAIYAKQRQGMLREAESDYVAAERAKWEEMKKYNPDVPDFDRWKMGLDLKRRERGRLRIGSAVEVKEGARKKGRPTRALVVNREDLMNVQVVYDNGDLDTYRSIDLVLKVRGNAQRARDLGFLAAVFHGTPHTWAPEPGFPHGRFRLDKIGTGEGAQAYGWGAYLADAEEVAQHYKEILHKGGDVLFDGEPLVFSYIDAGMRGVENFLSDHTDLDNSIWAVNAFFSFFEDIESGGTPYRALSYAKHIREQYAEEVNADELSDLDDALNWIERNIDRFSISTEEEPSLYTLDIPDEYIERMLLYDAPLNEQPEFVQQALRKEGIMTPLDAKAPPEGSMGARLRKQAGAQALGEYERLYMALAQALGGKKAASEYLGSIGIPGLRFLDQGSRLDSKNPTYNHVVWDQKVLDEIAVLERNGEKLDAIREAEREVGFMVAPEAKGRPYESAPDGLMGFKKNGPQTPYEENNYRTEITVRLTLSDGTVHIDGINGVNVPHAMERARRNWPGIKVEFVREGRLRQDAAYLSAVEAGDMGAAQRMVDEAAKRAGYVTEAYHAGTVKDKFDQRYAGTGPTGVQSGYIYFGSDRQGVDFYEDEGAPTRRYYLDTTNFREFDGGTPRENADQAFIEANEEDEEFFGAVTRGVIDGAREMDVYTIPYDEDGTTHAAKLADPVTYDDAGNVIPLSERFDQDSPDVRFMVSPEIKERAFKQAQPKTADVDAIHEQTHKMEESPVGWFAEGWLRRFVSRFGNSLYALQDLEQQIFGGLHPLFSKSITVASRTAKGAAAGIAKAFLESGVLAPDRITTVYKSYKAIIKQASGALPDLSAYLVAKRTLDIHRADLKRHKAWEEGGQVGKEPPMRQTGVDPEVAERAIKSLESIYPEFSGIADQLYEYQDHMLSYLVGTGVLTQKAADAMREMYHAYVPLYRLMHDKEAADQYGIPEKFVDLVAPVRRLKGSERFIIDPLESIQKNVYWFTQIAEQARVGQLLHEYFDDPYNEALGLIQRVRQPQRPVNVSIKNIEKKMWDMGLEVSFQEAAETDPDAPAFEDSETIDGLMTFFTPQTMFPQEGVVSVLVDGKRISYKVNHDVWAALEGINRENMPTILKTLGLPARMLRAGVVLAPEFFLGRNIIRDAFTAMQYTATKGIINNYVPGALAIKGILKMFFDPAAVERYLQSGGDISFVHADRTHLQKSLKSLEREGPDFFFSIKHPLEALRIVSSALEQTTRLGEHSEVYRQAKAAGVSEADARAEAAIASRNVTQDFERLGSYVKPLNMIAAFFGPNVGEYHRIIEQITQGKGMQHSGEYFKNTMGLLAKGTLTLTVPTLIMHALFNDDDPRYEELPQWQKDLFWTITTGSVTHEEWAAMSPKEQEAYNRSHPIIRIPKPFGPGIVFATIPERIAVAIRKREPGAAVKDLGALFQANIPNPIPTAMSVAFGEMYNRDWRGLPIVPESQQGLNPDLQYSPYQREVTKALGGMLNVSPRRIAHILYGVSGGLGQTVLDAAEITGKSTGLLKGPEQPARVGGKIPVISGLTRAFVATFPSGAQESIQTFYDRLGDARKAKNSLAEYRKGRDMESARKELEANRALIQQAPRLEAIAKRLGVHRNRIEALIKNERMDGKTKRKKIDAIQLQMAAMAKSVL